MLNKIYKCIYKYHCKQYTNFMDNLTSFSSTFTESSTFSNQTVNNILIQSSCFKYCVCISSILGTVFLDLSVALLVFNHKKAENQLKKLFLMLIEQNIVRCRFTFVFLLDLYQCFAMLVPLDT